MLDMFWQNNQRNTKEYKRQTIFNNSSFSINLNIWTWIDYLSNVFLTSLKRERHVIETFCEKEENNTLKPNHFEKQHSSSSLLLTWGNNKGPKWQLSTQKASSMS